MADGSSQDATTAASSPEHVFQAQRWGILLWGFAVAVACLLQFCMASNAPLTLDEHASYWTIDAVCPSTLRERSLDVAAVPPLSSWLQQLSVGVFGRSEWAMRMPSVFCAILAVVLAGPVGKSVSRGSWLVGGTAAVLLAVDPNVLYQTTVGRSYGLVLLLSLLLADASFRWLRDPASLRRGVTWAVFAVAIVWTHYVAALAVLLSGPLIVAFGGYAEADEAQRRRILGLSLAVGGAVVAMCWPLLTPVFRLAEMSDALSNKEQQYGVITTLGGVLVGGAVASTAATLLRRWFARRSAEQPSMPTGLTRPELVVLAVMAIAPLLALWALSRGDAGALASPRYRLIFLPAAVLLVSQFIGRSVSNAALGILVVCTVCWGAEFVGQNGSLAKLIERPASASDADWQQVAAELSSVVAHDDVVFVQGGLAEGHLLQFLYEDPLFSEYVASRVSRFYLATENPRIGMPFLWDRVQSMRDWYLRKLERGVEDGVVWAAFATDTDLNRNSLNGFLDLIEGQGVRVVTAFVADSVVLLKLEAEPPAEGISLPRIGSDES